MTEPTPPAVSVEETAHELNVLWQQAMTYQARGDKAASERMKQAHRRILAFVRSLAEREAGLREEIERLLAKVAEHHNISAISKAQLGAECPVCVEFAARQSVAAPIEKEEQ